MRLPWRRVGAALPAREETGRVMAMRYRLRVGSFRVLFMLEGDLIVVYSIKDRKQAYE